MTPEDLITYCGLYGGSCARYKGFTAFREAVRLVAEVVDSHGFHHWMPDAVEEFDYTEFRKGLDFFGKEDTWLVCQKCCKGGSSGPPDCVRKCCEEHQVNLCFECEEFPCDKVAGDAAMLESAKEYKELGKEKWLQRVVEKARQGFEFHTEKYYQIWAKECPPTPDPDKNE